MARLTKEQQAEQDRKDYYSAILDSDNGLKTCHEENRCIAIVDLIAVLPETKSNNQNVAWYLLRLWCKITMPLPE